MKIALLGYGKMGKAIEKIAIDRGHEIVLRKTRQSGFEGLEHADVAIDFSIPDAAVSNISVCFATHVPIVCGTTGWLQHFEDMTALCKASDGTFIYGSNFSLGVNLFFELNRQLAQLMSKFDQYDVHMEEIHHTQKLDSPSGTAITLAQDILPHCGKSKWVLTNPKAYELHIEAKRIEHVPGTHTVIYDSEIDSIEIKHTAHSREGFALGAVLAAEYISDKKGIFTMKDVLSLPKQ